MKVRHMIFTHPNVIFSCWYPEQNMVIHFGFYNTVPEPSKNTAGIWKIKYKILK